MLAEKLEGLPETSVVGKISELVEGDHHESLGIVVGVIRFRRGRNGDGAGGSGEAPGKRHALRDAVRFAQWKMPVGGIGDWRGWAGV